MNKAIECYESEDLTIWVKVAVLVADVCSLMLGVHEARWQPCCSALLRPWSAKAHSLSLRETWKATQQCNKPEIIFTKATTCSILRQCETPALEKIVVESTQGTSAEMKDHPAPTANRITANKHQHLFNDISGPSSGDEKRAF